MIWLGQRLETVWWDASRWPLKTICIILWQFGSVSTSSKYLTPVSELKPTKLDQPELHETEIAIETIHMVCGSDRWVTLCGSLNTPSSNS